MVLAVRCQYKEEQAGSSCVTLFRLPRLRWCSPQVTSVARIKGFVKINFANFFYIYEPLLRLINFASHRLFNYEETRIIVVQHKVCLVVSDVSLSSA
jgi:hypothetical protein